MILYQSLLLIHLHKVLTEKLSSVSVFQDITNLYISNTLSSVLGQSFVDYREVGNRRCGYINFSETLPHWHFIAYEQVLASFGG